MHNKPQAPVRYPEPSAPPAPSWVAVALTNQRGLLGTEALLYDTMTSVVKPIKMLVYFDTGAEVSILSASLAQKYAFQIY